MCIASLTALVVTIVVVQVYDLGHIDIPRGSPCLLDGGLAIDTVGLKEEGSVRIGCASVMQRDHTRRSSSCLRSHKLSWKRVVVTLCLVMSMLERPFDAGISILRALQLQRRGSSPDSQGCEGEKESIGPHDVC